MGQETIRGYAAQQKSATAHIAAPDEFMRELQSAPEDWQQMIHIFSRGNASQ
jgi:hypothetical protein